jgi:hypothetical protein
MPHASHDSPATLLWGELSGYCRPDEGKTARITSSAITLGGQPDGGDDDW